MKIEFRDIFLVFYFAVVRGIKTTKDDVQQGSVQDFLGNLTSLLNEGNKYFTNSPSYREKNLNDDYLNAITQHFSNLQNQNGAPIRPNNYPPPANSQNQNGAPIGPNFPSPDNFQNQGPPIGPNFPQPQPPPPPPGFPPGFRPAPGRPFPPIYQPPFGSYPQYPPNSFIGALGSISRYDDLRCVPRLLCEVTASRRPYGYKEEGQLPFVSKEVLITLLTVLNFVDDSPILSFARAALLGYSSRGDIRSCLTAYPTCPRDPDQLVNYLNNHNGGFFRFFNQQLYQQPQYTPQYLKLTNVNKVNKAIEPKQDSKIYKVKTIDYQYSPQYTKYGFTSRILNNPLNIEEVPTAAPTLPVSIRYPKKISFRDETVAENDFSSSNNVISPTRTGKRFSFPERADKSVKSTGMIFPDRTGTGNLILSADSLGKYRIIFANEPDIRKGKIKFLSDNDRVMRFPEDE